MSSSPPTVLGPYQIIREIARSNDIVYEAYDPTMNRRVAIKELAMPQGATPQQREDRLQRFKREAQAAGTLAHPNIMTVYSFAEDGGRQYMAMEFLDGHTLRNEIDTQGVIPPDRAIEIAKEVLQGLAHAHEKGVVHRDIKPDNIQVLSGGQIKITDFGIARLTFQPNLTMDGQVFGTPSYMSPEQVVGREIDARSDVFSVGVVLYEMLSGTKPFPGDSVVAITYAIMNAEPNPINQASHSVWQVIRQALDKSPALRFASAKDMMRALDDAVRQTAAMSAPAPYSANPYAPQFQTGPVPPPLVNPYLTPNAPPITPPPVVYPYNPYQAANPGAYDPNAMGQQAPYMPPAPVYYPPPPRQPLISPEMRVFLSKLFGAIVLLGTLIWFVLSMVMWMSNLVTQNQQSQRDKPKVDQIASLDPNLPTPERIQEAERIRSQLQSPSERDRANAQIAEMYRSEAERQAQRGDPVSAEASIQAASELDTNNADNYVQLARLLSERANLRSTDPERAITWREAADAWTKAAVLSREASVRSQRQEEAAKALYMYASIGYDARVIERSAARQALYDAQALVAHGSDIYATIDQLLVRLR